MVRLPTHSDTPQPKKKCGCQLGVTILIAFILVSWFLGPCAVFGVLSQPKAAFRSAGHSKLRWLAVEIVGTLLSYTGIITWLLYSIWIRPSVVRAGGRRRKKGAFFSVFFQALATPAAQSASPARSSSASSSARPSGLELGRAGDQQHDRQHATREMRVLQWEWEQTCFACQGRGRITIPAYAPHAGTSDGWRAPCTGSGETRCDSCGGSGKRS